MAGRQLIHPGPIDGDLLNQQNRHRSQFVWDGTGTDDHLRLRSNFKTYWDCIEANPLPQRIHDVVREAGFMGVLLTGSMRHDAGLISAFLDRWRPETHTFHLRFGEATVILEDDYYILGLRSVGSPVLPIGGYVGASLLHELLGVALDPELDMDVIKKGEIKISRLVRQFGDCSRLHSSAGDDYERELLYHTRAHLLLLIGSTVPNYSGYRMPLNLLPFVRHVEHISTYSWGSACLAYLYRRLCSASIGYKTELCGSMTLLQMQEEDMGDDSDEQDDASEEADTPVHVRQQPRRAVKGKGRLYHTGGRHLITHKMDKGKGHATPTNVKRGMRQLSLAESIERGRKKKESKIAKKSYGKVNHKILDEIKADKMKIERAYNDMSQTEEERIRQVDEVYKKYDIMEINLIEQDDNLIARYVVAHQQHLEMEAEDEESGE
ncbi:hypothetical protein AgCh_020962 [Apium graveolens]